jgi:hypothetical protein
VLGADNHQVLRDLGLDDAAIGDLAARGVIATRPRGL